MSKNIHRWKKKNIQTPKDVDELMWPRAVYQLIILIILLTMTNHSGLKC